MRDQDRRIFPERSRLHRGGPPAGRRRSDARQAEHDRAGARPVRRQPAPRQRRQPVEGGPRVGRLLERLRLGGRGPAGVRRAGLRHRRLDPVAGRLLWHRRAEADLRAGESRGRHGAVVGARSSGPHDPHRPRLRADVRADRRPRSARRHQQPTPGARRPRGARGAAERTATGAARELLLRRRDRRGEVGGGSGRARARVARRTGAAAAPARSGRHRGRVQRAGARRERRHPLARAARAASRAGRGGARPPGDRPARLRPRLSAGRAPARAPGARVRGRGVRRGRRHLGARHSRAGSPSWRR